MDEISLPITTIIKQGKKKLYKSSLKTTLPKQTRRLGAKGKIY